jgi:site-specific DNA-cytosine methylase
MNEKIRLMSVFSGFGGAEFALQKANIDFENVGFAEIDDKIEEIEDDFKDELYEDIIYQMNTLYPIKKED